MNSPRSPIIIELPPPPGPPLPLPPLPPLPGKLPPPFVPNPLEPIEDSAPDDPRDPRLLPPLPLLPRDDDRSLKRLEDPRVAPRLDEPVLLIAELELVDDPPPPPPPVDTLDPVGFCCEFNEAESEAALE
ncbi:MAG: hypothetical protein ACRD96_12235, partial [Bryobacteraceae bacterium]